MDNVFDALADPVRRVSLDRLRERNGQSLNQLCAQLNISRQAESKLVTRLEQARLVVADKRGRERIHNINPVPIHAIAERWISKIEHVRLNALSDPKRNPEGSDDV